MIDWTLALLNNWSELPNDNNIPDQLKKNTYFSYEIYSLLGFALFAVFSLLLVINLNRKIAALELEKQREKEKQKLEALSVHDSLSAKNATIRKDNGDNAAPIQQEELAVKIVDALRVVVKKGLLEDVTSQLARSDKYVSNLIENMKNDVISEIRKEVYEKNPSKSRSSLQKPQQDSGKDTTKSSPNEIQNSTKSSRPASRKTDVASKSRTKVSSRLEMRPVSTNPGTVKDRSHRSYQINVGDRITKSCRGDESNTEISRNESRGNVGTQHNKSRHNEVYHSDVRHRDESHNDARLKDTRHNEVRYRESRCKDNYSTVPSKYEMYQSNLDNINNNNYKTNEKSSKKYSQHKGVDTKQCKSTTSYEYISICDL